MNGCLCCCSPKRGAGPEQQKQKKATPEEMASILDCYVNRWQRWAAAGLQGFKIELCVYDARNLDPQAPIQIER
jgi:hypothetical protein